MKEKLENVNQESNATSKEVSKKSKAYAICAIIFGILGGWLSIYFAVYGLKWLYKGPEYSTERKMCFAGIGLFFVWLIALIVIFASSN